MKFNKKRIKPKHVKKAILIGVYSVVALSMVAWTIMPSLGL